MRHLLHIMTRPDQFAEMLIAAEQASPHFAIEVVDLTRSEAPDYDALLQKLLDADSVRVW